MMRHQVKCPGRGDNADCKTLHDLGNLQELRRHIENEQYVKKSIDSGHLSVQLDFFDCHKLCYIYSSNVI